MKKFFLDIFEYHNHFNQELIKQLIEHLDELPERTVPLFSHALNAHQIWNARITNNQPLGVHQVHSLNECFAIDNDNYSDTLTIIGEHELDEKVSYSNSKDIEFTNSIQEILFHIANHFNHHKGQIISDLRQHGINPIITDYIFYKR